MAAGAGGGLGILNVVARAKVGAGSPPRLSHGVRRHLAREGIDFQMDAAPTSRLQPKAGRGAHWFAAFGWLLLGCALSVVAPRSNRLYAAIYSDWNTSTYLRIRAFYWPGYVWLVASFLPAFITLYCGKWLQARSARFATICSLVSLGLASVFALDWLLAFVFCHEWGCSSVIGNLLMGALVVFDRPEGEIIGALRH